MKPFFRKLMRDQLQEVFDNPAKLIHKPTPKNGWINALRQALGMTSYQLAKRLQCSQSNIAALERREKKGTISLESLEATAQALNCKLVYFLIPNKPLNTLLEERARLVAKIRLKSVGHSMALEQQGLSPADQKQQEQELVNELLQENAKILWELDDEI